VFIGCASLSKQRITAHENVSHIDFSDLPLLGAHNRSEAEKRAAILATVRSCVLAFFDQYLTGINSELFNETAPTNEFVDTAQRFEAAKLPCPKQ
jgi:hypothetical protein